MRSFAFVLVAVLAACSGDNPPNVDADPRGPKCSGMPYDSCSTEHDCPNGTAPMCHTFQAEGFQVCTTSCTAGGSNTCPTGGTCNTMGICVPTAANMCHL
jgi:hypothetical protein